MSERRPTDPRKPRARKRRSSPLEELFHLLIENVNDYAIFILDPAGRALTWNAGVRRMLGYHEKEFVGLAFAALFRNDEGEAASAEMQRAAQAGRSLDERWHVRKDGSELWVSGVLTALYDPDGSLRGYAKIMRDATAQRRTRLDREQLMQRELAARQQAERANRMKDYFIAMVSHELRTPLNAILGSARLLATNQLDDASGRRAVERIERNARLQAKLVEDLLDLARIVAGKLRLDRRPVMVEHIVKSPVESVHHAAIAKSVTISMTASPDTVTVDGDPARLEQVMLNLLSNAVKFTPSGGNVDVLVRRRDDGMEVRVRDSGQGISSEELPHLFDRFHQGSSARSLSGSLGLGLTIARQIVEAHGGSIEACSDGEGTGATFVVRLPHATDEYTSGPRANTGADRAT